MRKFFDKLVGAVKSAWKWLKGTPPAKFIARCWNRAVDVTAGPFLKLFYGGPRRCKVFGSRVGYMVVSALWTAVLVPTAVGIGLYRLVKPPVMAVTRLTLTVVAYAWAALTVLWTLEVAFYYWVLNTVFNAAVRGFQWVWSKATGVPTTRRYTRYIPLREAFAFELGVFVWVHAGAARLMRRVIGDKPTWRIVQNVTDTVARLHGPTYDFWFGRELPYNTPQDGGETYALMINDVSDVNWHVEPEITEKEKSANWFVSNGFVLIATDAPDKSDAEVFNEYMRERWADLNVAEVATDEYGRTWAMPFRTQPMFRDVATVSPDARLYADQEMAWMTATDAVTKSYSYGRHWAAAIADQDASFLEDKDQRLRQRSFLYSKMRGRQDLHIEHILRGFDEWVGEHVAVTV